MSDQVYFVLCGRHIKIGRSGDIQKRIAAITSSHPESSVIAIVDGDADVERAFHKKLSRQRVSGEWFSDCTEVRVAIQRFQDDGLQSLDPFYVKTRGRYRAAMSNESLPVAAPTEWDLLTERWRQQAERANEVASSLDLLIKLEAPVVQLRQILKAPTAANRMGDKALDEAEIAIADDFDFLSSTRLCDRRDALLKQAADASAQLLATFKKPDLCGNSD